MWDERTDAGRDASTMRPGGHFVECPNQTADGTGRTGTLARLGRVIGSTCHA